MNTSSDSSSDQTERIEVDAEDTHPAITQLVRLLDEAGKTVDATALSEQGWSWAREPGDGSAAGRKSDLALSDGFAAALVPLDRTGASASVVAPTGRVVLLAAFPGRAQPGEAEQILDAEANRRGSTLVVRSQDAVVAFVLSTIDGASMCIPIQAAVYDGCVAGVVSGEPFVTRSPFASTASAAFRDAGIDPADL